MGKVAKITSRAGTVILCLVVAVAVVLLVLQALAGGGKALPGGYRPLLVLSGSMEPTIPVGSLIVTKSVDADAVKAGDVITFVQSPEEAGSSALFVTHRVSRVVTSDAGTPTFITKGDANNGEDLFPVEAQRLAGRVVLTVPYVGHLAMFVHSPLGLILMILIPGAALIAWEGYDIVRKRRSLVRGGGTAILAIGLCAFGIAQFAFASASPERASSAYFSVQSDILASVQAGTWEEPPQPVVPITLSPGEAKAVRHDGEPGRENFRIASIDPGTGGLALDFGEVHAGNSNNSVDVFRIRNTGDEPLEVTVAPSGGLEQFIARVGGKDGSIVLRPGEEFSVDVKLDVGKGAAPGDHRGGITITVSGRDDEILIPALITVITKGGSGGDADGAGNGNGEAKGSREPDYGDEPQGAEAPSAGGLDQQSATTTATAAVPQSPDHGSGQQGEQQGDDSGTKGDPQPGQPPERGANVETTQTTAVTSR